MARKQMKFLVTLTPPTGATAADLREYIEDAVQTRKGQMHPDEPLFSLIGTASRSDHLNPEKQS